MSILDDAVFLLQPTSVKASKIYSTFPTDGTGDFTFTRNAIKNRIAKNGLITKVQANVPSLSYKPISGVSDGCPHIAIEKESTNLIAYSDDFSQWTSVGNAVVTNNFITSPDGTKNAAKIVFDGTANARIEIQVTSTGVITQSIYLRTETGTQSVKIGATSTDTSTVTVTTEWQRFTHTSSSGTFPRVLCNDANTIYVSKAQAENKSFATSNIDSSGAATTRITDGSFSSDFSSSVTFPANTSTLVLWFSYNGKNGDFFKLLRFEDSAGENSLRLEVPTDNTINIYGDNISASGLLTNGFTLNPGTLCKIAITYDATSSKVYINGSGVSINTPTGVLNIINRIYNNTTSMNNINIHRVAVFNTVKTNSELTTLTS
jgi:hypothetical protein